MFEFIRKYLPWITGLAAIGGLVAMSLMEVPDTKLVPTPAAPAAAQPAASEPAETTPPPAIICADGSTKSYSDRPCEARERLDLIPFTIAPAPPVKR